MIYLSKNIKGSLLVAISALMFGSYGVFARYFESYPVFYQTFVRCLIITVVFAVYGLLKKQFKKIEKKDLNWFIIILIFTNFTVAPIVYAFQKLQIGTASFLFYASFTVFTYLLGLVFFKEKMNLPKIVSLLLSLIGLLLIFTFSLSWILLIPMLMAILNGVASAGEVTFSKKISQNYSNIQINTLVFGSIAFTHLLISLSLGETMDIQLVTTSLPVLLVFSAAAILGMVTVIAGFKYVEPSIGAIVGLLEIVFSVVFGIILFSEVLNWKITMGGALILIAALLPTIVELKQQRRKYALKLE